MDAIRDFEDILKLFARHRVRYLIVGGLAFIYHAKPRYTKDMDIWLDADPDNVDRANAALAEFGSPELLDPADRDEILQLGAGPARIDFLRETVELDFAETWEKRIVGSYGRAPANWIDLDSLIAIKERIDHPRHREDVRVLKMVKALKESADD